MKRKNKMVQSFTFSKQNNKGNCLYNSMMLYYPFEFVLVYTTNINDISDKDSHTWYDFYHKGNFGLTNKKISKSLKDLLKDNEYNKEINRIDDYVTIKFIPKFEVPHDWEYFAVILRRCENGRK